MSLENPLWGAPRIHGELLKLGFAVSQSTVGKYVARKNGPPGQSWSTFVRNHAPQIAAMDLFVVPTIGFELLFHNETRTHRSLNKDAPITRPIQRTGRIASRALVGGAQPIRPNLSFRYTQVRMPETRTLPHPRKSAPGLVR
jgi:hypothetical protein